MITALLLSGVAVAVGLQQPSTAPSPSAPASAPGATAFDLRISPLVELHFALRRAASITGDASGGAAWASAVEAVRSIERELGGGLAWGLLESALAGCESAAEAKELFPQLPESFSMRDGRKLPLRDMAVRLADALAGAEPGFMSETWPGHKAKLEEARTRIAAELLPKESECFAHLLKSLAMSDPGLPIPVYLVAEAPEPGAFTHRKRGGGGVCFVGLDSASGTQLYETILHESIHALDIATDAQDTVLQIMRRKLREAGIGPTDKRFRDVPHTLMFVQAAETVRAVLDPQHKHYGDVYGYYPKVPEATQAVRPQWEAHLRGDITREQAIDRIVGEAVKPSGTR